MNVLISKNSFICLVIMGFFVTGCSTDEKQTVVTKTQLVMSDEFNVDGALDTNLWSYNIGTGSNGWGNNELQYYTNQNYSLVDGILEIKAKKLSTLNSNYSIPDFLSFGSVNNLPYLLVMSIETASGPVIDTGAVLSDNSSCLDAPFAYTVKNSTAQTDEEASSSAQAATAASCGTIGPPSGPGPGQFLGILSLGFLLSVLPSKFAKRNKKILS